VLRGAVLVQEGLRRELIERAGGLGIAATMAVTVLGACFFGALGMNRARCGLFQFRAIGNLQLTGALSRWRGAGVCWGRELGNLSGRNGGAVFRLAIAVHPVSPRPNTPAPWGLCPESSSPAPASLWWPRVAAIFSVHGPWRPRRLFLLFCDCYPLE